MGCRMDPSQTYRVCPMAFLRFLVERTRSASMPGRRGKRRGRLSQSAAPHQDCSRHGARTSAGRTRPWRPACTGEGRARAVFPVDLEAEKIHVELPRLAFVENSMDRYHLSEPSRASSSPCALIPCALIWDLGLDELRQKHERFLPAEIASVGRNRFGNPFLRDVQLGPTGHLLQGNR